MLRLITAAALLVSVSLPAVGQDAKQKREKEDLDTYKRRLIALRGDDHQGTLGLARWALGRESARLVERGQDLLVRFTGREPTKETALLQADSMDLLHKSGMLPLNGKWLTESDFYRALGFVRDEGQWVLKDQAEARGQIDAAKRAQRAAAPDEEKATAARQEAATKLDRARQRTTDSTQALETWKDRLPEAKKERAHAERSLLAAKHSRKEHLRYYKQDSPELAQLEESWQEEFDRLDKEAKDGDRAVGMAQAWLRGATRHEAKLQAELDKQDERMGVARRAMNRAAADLREWGGKFDDAKKRTEKEAAQALAEVAAFLKKQRKDAEKLARGE